MEWKQQKAMLTSLNVNVSVVNIAFLWLLQFSISRR